MAFIERKKFTKQSLGFELDDPNENEYFFPRVNVINHTSIGHLR